MCQGVGTQQLQTENQTTEKYWVYTGRAIILTWTVSFSRVRMLINVLKTNKPCITVLYIQYIFLFTACASAQVIKCHNFSVLNDVQL